MIPPTDVIVVVSTLLAFIILAYYFGRGKGVSLLLAFYPTILFFLNFPYKNKLIFATGAMPIAINTVCIFLLFYIPTFLIISRFIDTMFYENRLAKSALLGLLLSIVFLATVHFVLPFDPIYHFGADITRFFIGDLFWWLLGPLLALFFI